MGTLRPAPNGYPIKIVRDKTASLINASGEPGDLYYEAMEDVPGDRIEWLQKKLGEEVTEYLVSGSFSELCDVYAVIEALAVAHGWSIGDLASELKVDPRGGFRNSIMMYGKHKEFDDAHV